MVSFQHEGVLRLVRDRPAFAADLIGQVFDVKIPRFREAQISDPNHTEIVPVEFRTDALVTFKKKKPVFGAIIESQLEPDEDKPFTWPLYATALRERHRCQCVVVVVTPKRATARWARQAVELGGGVRYWPLVVGPDEVPEVTDRAQAWRKPQLAVLSVVMHGRRELEVAAAIGAAAAHAVSQFPEDQRLVYSLMIQANLSQAARKAIEMQPEFEKFFSAAQRRYFERAHAEGEAKGEAVGLAKGEAVGLAKGKADALLKVLIQRGLTLTTDQHRRIIECADVAQLDRWFERALAVSSVAELLASRAPGNGNRQRAMKKVPKARRSVTGSARR